MPPFAGFTAKLFVLYYLFDNGGWWWALVFVIGINTILSAFYYFRVIRVMYLTTSDEPAFFPNPLGLAVSAGCAAMLVIMLLATSPLVRLTTEYGRMYLGTTPKGSVASIGDAGALAAERQR